MSKVNKQQQKNANYLISNKYKSYFQKKKSTERTVIPLQPLQNFTSLIQVQKFYTQRISIIILFLQTVHKLVGIKKVKNLYA